MRVVKLGATTSTNDFLKDMAADPAVENFTVVTAESQSAGRGQRGSGWVSEEGKNLIMSILIKDMIADSNQLFSLNVAVAMAVLEVLEKYDIPGLSVKWPNDIMSGNKKIGGILIENSFRANGAITSVAGIGLNVNQSDFSALPQASSLHVVTGRFFDKEEILEMIAERIVRNVHFIREHDDVLWQSYHSRLFKIDVPMAFENAGSNPFMGIVKGVTRDGKLELLLEDESVNLYDIKEIRMLY